MSKVFIMSSLHPWNDTRIFYKQAQSLLKDYEVELHAVADFKYKKVNGVDVFGLPKLRKRYLRPLIWFMLLIRAIKAKADIYHFHDPELLGLGLLLKIMRKKVIYDVHEDYPKAILNKNWIPKRFRGIVSRCSNFFEKRISQQLDFIITVTDTINNKFSVSNKEVIANFPLTAFNTKQINYDKQNGDECRIVYVGGLTRDRGIMGIIDALSYIEKENIKLFIAGLANSEEFDSIIRDRIKDDERIELCGFLEYHQVYELLNNSHMGLVCLHPIDNYIESFPIKMFEYMSVGIPIIASDFPLWIDLVSGNSCGINVNPLKPKEISEAIELLNGNIDLRIEMGKNGYEAFINKYNWDIEEKKLLQSYKSLLKTDKGSIHI